MTLSNALLVHLSQLPWPGNVRQLQSVLKVMLALADEGDTLTPDALPEAYRAAPAPLPRGGLQAHDEQLIVDTPGVNGQRQRQPGGADAGYRPQHVVSPCRTCRTASSLRLRRKARR